MTDDTGRKDDKLCHQLRLGHYHDAGALGGFGLTVWMEWFDAHRGTDVRDCDLQEVDYTAYWQHEIKPLATVAEVGWIAETFPPARGDAFYTHEWYLALMINDREIFGTKDNVLSPHVAYYMDMDDRPGGWLEWGISHCFAPADLGLAKVNVLKDVTVTPSFNMGIDHGQLGPATRVAELRYGLEVCYDLSNALSIPEKFGRVAVTGFVYFVDSVFEARLKDRFYGGMTLSYSF